MARGGTVNPWVLGAIFIASAIGVVYVLIQISKHDGIEPEPKSAADPVMIEVSKLKGQILAHEENGRLKDETIQRLAQDFKRLEEEMKEIERETDLFQQHLAKATRAPVIQFPEKMRHYHFYQKPAAKRPAAAASDSPPAVPPTTQKRAPSKAPVGIVRKIKKQLKDLE